MTDCQNNLAKGNLLQTVKHFHISGYYHSFLFSWLQLLFQWRCSLIVYVFSTIIDHLLYTLLQCLNVWTFKGLQLHWECCYVPHLHPPFWSSFNSIWLPLFHFNHFINIFRFLSALVPTCSNRHFQCIKLQPTFSSKLTWFNHFLSHFSYFSVH